MEFTRISLCTTIQGSYRLVHIFFFVTPVSSLYTGSSPAVFTWSSQIHCLVLTAPGPTKAMIPKLPIPGGCSPANQPLTPSSGPLHPSLYPASGHSLMVLVWVILKVEESVCILIWIQLYHLLWKYLYILNQRSRAASALVSRCPSLTKDDYGPHHTGQLPCFRHSSTG